MGAIFTQVILAMLVALLAWRLLRHTMFRRSLTAVATLAGAILLIGGMVTQSVCAVLLPSGSPSNTAPVRDAASYLASGIILQSVQECVHE